MAAAYLVALPTSMCKHLQDKVDAVIVYANDTTDAKAMAKARMGSDMNAMWDNAVVTAIAAKADWTGFRFVVKETYPSGALGVSCDVTATGAAQDTLDEIGAVLATALSGTYNSSTQVIQLAASGRGDNSLEINVYPPVAMGQDFGVPGVVPTITHRGANGSALSFTLAADAYVIPNLVARVRMCDPV